MKVTPGRHCWGASFLLWLVHALVLRGVQTAASINLAATLAKLLPIGGFIILAGIAFSLDTFSIDFTGLALHTPVWQQVKDTMLITLWVFIGVEGAVVVSARARNKKDVGRATMLAVISALSVYLLITLLSLGVVPRAELAGMRNPSMAGIMVEMIGPWGEIIIATGLIISVCGAYLSWTIMAAEVPMVAAKHGAFPKIFRHQIKQRASSILMVNQQRGTSCAGFDLADRQQLQYLTDNCLGNDSGALFSRRCILI